MLKEAKKITLNILNNFCSYIVLTLLLSQLAIVSVFAEISQIPLFLSSSVDPNIVFVLDDSGSMQVELMPEKFAYSFFVFPRGEDIYGNDNITNYVPTFEDGYAYSAWARCPQKNIVYYNPAITYKPWSNYDGLSLMPTAIPTAAYHNPKNTAAGYRNLTVINTQSAYWDRCTGQPGNTCSLSSVSQTFYPAIYFVFTGDDEWNFSDYSKVEIKSTTATYSGDGRESRTDCSGGVCTYSQEMQNFANWYTYYRSRVLAARAGIGKAFAEQDENLRVGFATINKGSGTIDGVSTQKIVSGVRPFTGSARQDFFTNLYSYPIPNSTTPLREALDYIGKYYQRIDNRGPWGETPGTDDATVQLSCRNSYTILMTDGYWNGNESSTWAARANNDGTNGPTITGPDSQTFTYKTVSPFTDSHSNTLADVAMYYWKNDLRASLANRVPVSALNPAFWQHMVTFGIGLGVQGSVDSETAFNAIYNNDTISWADSVPVDAEDSTKIDDLLHASVNSRGGFFSAADPDTFAKELSNTLSSIVSRTESSASAIATNSTRLVDESLIFQARFDSSDWSGELRAYKIESDGSIGDIKWSTDDTGVIPTYNNRNIVSWDGSAGIEFDWNNLSTPQQAQLTEDQVDWLQGDQSKEVGQTDGVYRQRDKLLGDIVNSDPFVVGVPNFSYDLLAEGVAGQATYVAFRDSIASRSRMLYVGGNDGMLHGLVASTGVEKFAYVPSGVYPNLAGLSNVDYSHKYFVDGSPTVGDAYLSSGWKTLLVGSLGAGGRSVFALDITDPDSFDQGDVLWEFGYDAAIECTAGVTACKDMGYSFGTPTVARMQNGVWAVIFGNGYGSDDHKSKLFVVNAETGTLITTIDAGTDGDAAAPNGLSTPSFLADSNRTITTAYAGDLLGNLWKFDLSDIDPSDWEIPVKFDDPLFTAPSNQSITAPIEIGSHSEGGNMIYFGTGKYFETTDSDVSVPTVNPGTQTFYGIWDQNLTTDRSDLTEQTIDYEGKLFTGSDIFYRIVSDNSVPYAKNSDRGWYLDLVSPSNGVEGERVISSPLLRRGRVIFTTVIPIEDPCSTGGTSWLMELDAFTGGRLDGSVLDVNDDGVIDDEDKVTIVVDGEDVQVPVSGRQSEAGIVKTPAVIESGTLEYKYFGGSDGEIEVVVESGGDDDSFGRRSWQQLR